MKACTKYIYGGPEVLHLEDINIPEIKDHQLLIKVVANSINAADWRIMRGIPFMARFAFGLLKPKIPVLGTVAAGIVEKVGEKVTKFKVGDRICGVSLTESGTFAQYAVLNSKYCAAFSPNLDFKEMACVPIAGVTALQALIHHGKLKKSEKILINGATGGVGHFAVQIAKIFGAHVTAVCSSKKVEFVKSLGADAVIPYDQINIHKHNKKYNLVLDNHGNLTYQDFKRLGDRGILIGLTTLRRMMSVILLKSVMNYPLVQFTAHDNTKDLETLAMLIKDGKLKVHIDKIYPYTQIPDAMHHIESIHPKGKVAIDWRLET